MRYGDAQISDQQQGEGIRRKDQAVIRLSREARDRRLDVRGVADGGGDNLHAERRRGGLDRTHEELGLRGCFDIELTATRVRPDAICFSKSSHLPPIENS